MPFTYIPKVVSKTNAEIQTLTIINPQKNAEWLSELQSYSATRYAASTALYSFLNKFDRGKADQAWDWINQGARYVEEKVSALIKKSGRTAQATSTTQQLTAWTKDYENGEVSPYLYRFRINPVSMNIRITKDYSATKTGSGWKLRTWGEALRDVTFNGTTGYLRVPDFLRELGIYNIRLSPVYLRFMMFEKFVSDSSNDVPLVFVIDNKIMKGILTGFSYTIDAKDPFVINFTINAKIYPNGFADIDSGDLESIWGVFYSLQQVATGEAPWGTENLKKLTEGYTEYALTQIKYCGVDSIQDLKDSAVRKVKTLF